MLSQVIAEESKIKKSNTTVLSLAPGIIDTGMQTEIRNSSKDGFSNIERFIEYKKKSELYKDRSQLDEIGLSVRSKFCISLAFFAKKQMKSFFKQRCCTQKGLERP